MTASPVRIELFQSRWRNDFERLNAHWLRKYFRIEPIDADVLGDPETHILAGGGEVLYALIGDEVVGTCALMAAGDGEFELTKMAVDESVQGHGIGRKLIEAAIAQFRARNGRVLFLETNSVLKPAITLYESVGFVHQPAIRANSHYDRADVYMIWQGVDA